MVLSAGHDKVVQTTSLTISGAGKLDLADNAMIVDYPAAGPSPIQSIRAQLQTGYAGGDWSGNGITSSSAAADAKMGIGYAENSILNRSTFHNIAVDSSALLMDYALLGDANLDRRVDASDLGRLASHWQSSGFWTDGDFDYNGFVDVADLGLLASNWQATVASAPDPGSLTDALAALGLPEVTIPEPATIGWLAPLSLAGARRRRRVGS
jgi:hypothetical protein